MRAFGTSGENVTGTSAKTAVTVIGSASVRPRVYHAIFGNKQTPNDYSIEYALRRFTAAGTAGSTPTISKLDSDDGSVVATAGAAHSAEPTYSTGNIIDIAF